MKMYTKKESEISEEKSKLISLSNTIKNNFFEIHKIILLTLLSIGVFEICFLLKFFGDYKENIYFYIVTILLSIFIYALYKIWVKNRNIINTKYLNTKRLDWQFRYIIIIVALFMYLCISYLLHLNVNTKNEERNIDKLNGMSMLNKLFSGVINPGIIEEICFRGILFIIILGCTSYLFNKNKKKHDWFGITFFLLVSSLLFGFAHVVSESDFNNVGIYILAGLIYSAVYILTRDLKDTIILHMLANTIPTLSKTEWEPFIYIIFFILIIALLFIILSKSIKSEKT